MTKTIARSLAVVLCFWALFVVGQEFTLKVTSNLVLLDISVKGSRGAYVSGLSKDQFQILENGKPQTISSFSHEDVPVTVGLVLDTSGSMTRKYDQVVTAGLVFARYSNPKDEIFIVTFNDTVKEALPPGVAFSDDPVQLRDAMLGTKPTGRTSLYDAIAEALKHLDKGTRDKKTLIVISDGGDNHSVRKLPEVMRLIEESHATIYTIGLFDSDDDDKNPGVLKQLSTVTGGETYLPKETSDLQGICQRVAADIRARYTIGYIPSSSDDGNVPRKIKVAATGPDGRKLTVHTRTSYSLPREGKSLVEKSGAGKSLAEKLDH